jgi:hypothetical protein
MSNSRARSPRGAQDRRQGLGGTGDAVLGLARLDHRPQATPVRGSGWSAALRSAARSSPVNESPGLGADLHRPPAARRVSSPASGFSAAISAVHGRYCGRAALSAGTGVGQLGFRSTSAQVAATGDRSIRELSSNARCRARVQEPAVVVLAMVASAAASQQRAGR